MKLQKIFVAAIVFSSVIAFVVTLALNHHSQLHTRDAITATRSFIPRMWSTSPPSPSLMSVATSEDPPKPSEFKSNSPLVQPLLGGENEREVSTADHTTDHTHVVHRLATIARLKESRVTDDYETNDNVEIQAMTDEGHLKAIREVKRAQEYDNYYDDERSPIRPLHYGKPFPLFPLGKHYDDLERRSTAQVLNRNTIKATATTGSQHPSDHESAALLSHDPTRLERGIKREKPRQYFDVVPGKVLDQGALLPHYDDTLSHQLVESSFTPIQLNYSRSISAVMKGSYQCQREYCTEFLSQRDYWMHFSCTDRVQKNNDLASLPDGRCHFMDGTRRAPVAIASFPGSGNTWVRGLLEKATGICTG